MRTPFFVPLALATLGLGLSAQTPGQESRAFHAEAASRLQEAPQVDLRQLSGLRRHLTLCMLDRLKDPEFRAFLGSRIKPGQTMLPMEGFLKDYLELWPGKANATFTHHFQELDRQLRLRKGLEKHSTALLGLTIIWPKSGSMALDLEKALFVVKPDGRGKVQAPIEAYDLRGGRHWLDPQVQPEVPVLLMGLDGREDVRAGLACVNEGLRKAGIQNSDASLIRTSTTPTLGVAAQTLTAPILCTKLNYVRLSDDQEPWIKGAAEIYAMVSGIDPTVTKPEITIVDMPYLDYDNTDYYPNQILLFWNSYGFAAANIQFMEHDDGADYQKLLNEILTAVSIAMKVVPATAPYSFLVDLANAIIKAMPQSWYIDEDDYVDTLYTIEKGQSYTNYPCAGGKARVNLAPYTLQPN